MVVSLWIRDLANSWSFKEICTDCSSRNLPILVKLNFNKFTKTTATNSNNFVRSTKMGIFVANGTWENIHATYLELLFLTVLAFPNASNTGLDCRSENITAYTLYEYQETINESFKLTSKTCCSTVLPSVADLPPMNARYLMSIFVVSVLPAPLSPLTKMDWLPFSFIIALTHWTESTL